MEWFPFDHDVARRIADALRAAIPDIGFAIERQDGFAFDPSYVPMYELPKDVVVGELETLLTAPIIKLLARHPELSAGQLLDKAHETIDDLADIATATYSMEGGLLEISAAGISKAYALERVAAEHGIGAPEVIAFGDMPNDIPLLTWAGRGIAMANAHPDLVAVADEITATNDDDGVAVVVERLLATRSR